MNDENNTVPARPEYSNVPQSGPLPLSPDSPPKDMPRMNEPVSAVATPPSPTVTARGETRKSTILTILGLILLPLVGIIAMWHATKWKLFVKIPVTVIAAIYMPVHALLTLYFGFFFLYAGGNIQVLLPQDQFAKTYLEDRYHEEFVIGQSLGSDALGDSITYSKRVHPKRDPSLEFTLSKCLARCDLHESTDFHDTYAHAVWSKQLTDHFTRDLGLHTGQSVSVHTDSNKDTEILAKHNGKIPDFYTLTTTERNLVGASVSYDETDGSYTAITREQHALRILKIVALLKTASVKASSVTYDIRALTPSVAVSKSTRDQYHFTTDHPLGLTRPSDIYSRFVIFTYGRGVIRDGYEAQQKQLNTSRARYATEELSPTAAISTAKQELALAADIRQQVASNYLVAPYVVVVLRANGSAASAPDFSTLSATDYTVEVTVYNYPDTTIPMTAEEHRSNVVLLTQLLQQKFPFSKLSYKTDASTCNVESINASTVSKNAATECFKS